jgi:uncharacterized phage protein (TIGR02218 family)
MRIHMAGSPTNFCNIWEATAHDGKVIRAANHTRNLYVGGKLYRGVPLKPSQLSQVTGLSPDNAEVTAVFARGQITEDDVLARRWSNARVVYETRNYLNTALGWGERMTGYVGEVTTQRGLFVAEIRGLTQLLQQETGDLYSEDCRADRLGDNRCRQPLAAYTHGLTVAEVRSQSEFRVVVASNNVWGAAAPPDSYFPRGWVEWLTGRNAPLEMDVKAEVSAGAPAGSFWLTLFLPMSRPIAVGDMLLGIRGCDRKRETCKTFVNHDNPSGTNIENFQGEPDVPGEREVFKFPDS